MPCYVDFKQTREIYKSCCIEFDKPEDCTLALKLVNNGKSYHDCEHFKEKEQRNFPSELEAIASHLYPSVMGEAAQDAAYYIKQLETLITELERK